MEKQYELKIYPKGTGIGKMQRQSDGNFYFHSGCCQEKQGR